jgi:MFS family permease
MPQRPGPSAHSQRGLDWLNFFVADVETAFGPFVAVYLAQNGWSQGAIGTVIAVNSAVAVVTQVPAGWIVDWTRAKRLVVGVCLFCIAAGSLLIALFPVFLPVTAAEALHGVTGGAIRSAVAAIALGLVGHRVFHTRVGRNHRYDSFGNAATAGMMGLLGHLVSPRSPFFAAAALCVPAAASLGFIRSREIDYARARQSVGRKEEKAARWREIFRHRTLLVFAGCLFLFQFANASMLPLASERLAADYRGMSELVTSALVIVPQVVTALIATWLARKADEWGRRKLLLLAFSALLARTILFAVAFAPWYLLSVQVLGGFTAAVIGIMTPLVVADCTKQSGRYNFSLGSVSMVATVGATISTSAVGFVAQSWGFLTGFLVLAAVAAAGLAMLWFLFPETAQAAREAED